MNPITLRWSAQSQGVGSFAAVISTGDGPPGPANSLTIGTVTGLTAGSTPTASLTGTSPAQVLNLGIPAGYNGTSPNLTMGTVTAGGSPSASITGAFPNYVLNLVLVPGAMGAVPAFSIGTVTTLSPGSSATAAITGTASAPVLNLGLPDGATGSTGPAPNVTVGTVTALAAGATPTASITGTNPNYTLNLGIPAGATGGTGGAGPTGLQGNPGYLSYSLYTDLSAVTSTAGNTAYCYEAGTGTHTDPVVGGTVPNAGVFAYSTSPAGWKWISPLPADATAALAALVGYVDSDVTVGATPIAGTDYSGAGSCGVTSITTTVFGYLKSFSAYVTAVGDGTALLLVTLPWQSGAGRGLVGKISLTGITSTGLKTFYAGPDFPSGLPILPGSEFSLGNAGAGAHFGSLVVAGTGFYIPSTAGGYGVPKYSGTNYVPYLQITTTTKTTVAVQIAKGQSLAAQIALDGYVTEYAGPEDLIFGPYITGAAFAGNAYPNGGIAPTTRDMIWTGTEYAASSGTVGDCYFIAFSNNQFAGYYRATLTTGSKNFAANPNPIFLPAGSIIVPHSITGYVLEKGYSRQPSYFPNSNYLFNGAVFDRTGANYTRFPCVRAVGQRPRYAREFAQAATRGSTLTVRQSFQGTTLPTGSTRGANPPQWVVGAGATFTCNNGLISPSAPTPSYSNTYIMLDPSTAHRRTVLANMLMGNASNIGGLVFVSQQGSTSKMGTVLLVDGPAGLFRAYSTDQSNTPQNGGLSVAMPWAPDPADKLVMSITRNRQLFTATLTKTQTGQSCSLTWIPSSVAVHGGYMSGQLGAIFYSGPGGMRWNQIEARTGFRKTPGAKLIFDDSTGDSVFIGGVNGYARAWWDIVEDNRGRGDMLNCSKSSTDTGAALNCLYQDFTALVGGDATGVEVFWCPGVNPRHGGAETDAQWYANYKADTLAAAAIVTGLGGKFTIVTPNPADYIATYVQLLVSNVLAGDLGDFDVIDINGMLAASDSTRGNWNESIAIKQSIDKLHPEEIFTTTLVAANVVAQRADLA